MNKVLEKLYNDKDLLFVFKNGLQTLWLSYCTTYIVSQNQYLAEYFKEEKEKPLKTNNHKDTHDDKVIYEGMESNNDLLQKY